MKAMRIHGLLLLLASGIGSPVDARQDGSPESVLAAFSRAWPEGRTPYRTEGDASWVAYAGALRRLVGLGDKAVPALVAGCADGNFQVRALCARTLGFLGAKPATAALIKLLDDPQAPVAILAADALGQIQEPVGLKALEEARSRLKNGDVLLHVSKALERKVPVESDLREQILKIDPRLVNSAQLGRAAPDFTLKDSIGTDWALSSFKGKKSVVLVFIYGDG